MCYTTEVTVAMNIKLCGSPHGVCKGVSDRFQKGPGLRLGDYGNWEMVHTVFIVDFLVMCSRGKRKPQSSEWPVRDHLGWAME